MIIKNRKVQSCTIHGSSVRPETIYKVAMPDYVANGGDGLKMLIPLERVQTGRLVRDILIAYAEEITRNGHPISASIEGRIVNSNKSKQTCGHGEILSIGQLVQERR